MIGKVIQTQLYIKVEFQHGDPRETQKVANEIAHAVKKIYGVRKVEIQNLMSEELPDPKEEED
jgi:ribosomal protein S3AE